MNSKANSRERQYGIWLLLVTALFMRAVMPQGYMPDAGQQTITVKLCHSSAVMTLVLPPKEGHGRSGEGRDQPPCAFANLAPGALPAADLLALPLPKAVLENFSADEAPFALAAVARQLPPARAPPAYG